MTLTGLISYAAGIALVATSTLTMAQTVISNETLVTTTFVVIKDRKMVKCGRENCRAVTSMLEPIPVTCPGSSGQTCTLHISLDVKVSLATPPGSSIGPGGSGFYQFLVDNAAPNIGPTGPNGGYLLEANVWTDPNPFAVRQSLSASVLAGVTNTESNSHTIAVNIGCRDLDHKLPYPGCEIASHQGTMRVDVFQP